MDALTISIFSLVIALIAVFFGPLIQLRIAKKQSQNLTSLSIWKDWTQDLRNGIAEFIATIYHHLGLTKFIRAQNMGHPLWAEALEEKKKAFQLVFRVNQLRFQIITMLDQEDEKHCKVIDILNEINSTFDEPYSAKRDNKIVLLFSDLLAAMNMVINSTNKKMFEGK